MEEMHDGVAAEQAAARIADRAERPQEPIDELASLIRSVFRFEGGELRELAAALYRPLA